ncbi:MAG: hypothetical protein AAE977_03780 [Thermoplasmataceae archaeon]|jgi:hypothetical protein
MAGRLKIWREDKFEQSSVVAFLDKFQSEESIHLVLSDGIIIDPQIIKEHDTEGKLKIQRILTPYQLERILMESDNYPYMICIRSDIIDSWSVHVMESLYDIMRIKSNFYGCIMETLIVGQHGIFENYFGRKFYNPIDTTKYKDGLYTWEEAPLQ